MFSYMVQTSGNSQGERLFHRKAQALRAFERMPVMDGDYLTLKQGTFERGRHGLVYSYGRVFTLAQRCGADEALQHTD